MSTVPVILMILDLGVTELREVVDECERLIDRKMGDCPDCHGSGRDRISGDECWSCGGTGKLEDYDRIMDSDDGEGEDA